MLCQSVTNPDQSKRLMADLRLSIGSMVNVIPAILAVLVVFTATSISHADETDNDQAKPAKLDVLHVKGKAIWEKSCADCHGREGMGVEGLYETPLAGDKTIGQLAEVIAATMPEGDPSECVGDDAEAVAAWIHHAFYSEAARLRNRPPRVLLTHLTANQLRHSLADLYSYEHDSMWRESQRGLNAVYFDGARWSKDKIRIERVDPVINFDWGKESPGAEINPEDFYIHWRAGLKVDVTGRYEIVMNSTAAFKMEFGRYGRLFFDNLVQSGDRTEFRKSVTLLAGRVYPLQIELFQRKRKTEQPPVRVSLSWVPPDGIEEVIPNRHLIAASAPATYAPQVNLPPDDRSYGYDRGLAIDRSWDESTTQAAVEFAAIATRELWPSYLRNHRKEGDENRSKLRNFMGELAEIAFRGPLSDQERTFYIDEQIDHTEDDALAIKRCLLTILKSPRFLYPGLDRDRSASQQAANRLALILFDSLPADRFLRDAVKKNQLESEEQIRAMAERMVGDYRCEGKMREMLLEWLNVSHYGEIVKDREKYPGFDRELVSDLRISLHLLLDDAIIDSDGDYRDLLTANWAYTNSRLAEFYGEQWSTAQGEPESDESERDSESADQFGLLDVDEFVKVRTQPPYQHGVLSHPYVMSGLAYHDVTSPIHRGVFLVRYMLGRTLRPPSEAFTPISPDLHPELTTRERVQMQTGALSCQACHSTINELGFTLENFDAVGRYREKERNKPINPSGGYVDRNGETHRFSGPADLARYLAESEDAHQAFVSRVFQHFVKQPISAYGAHALEDLTDKFRQGNYNLRNLIVEVAVIAAMPTPTDK